MSAHATAAEAHHDDHPTMPLWGLFIAMVVFTGIEVGLYEIWKAKGVFIDGEFVSFIPKLVLVFLIFLFTIPKFAIVLIYFMHLKFEKLFVIGLCVLPFIFAGIAIFTTLADSNVLKGQTFARPTEILGHGELHHADEHGEPAAGHGEEGESHDDAAEQEDEDY